MTQQLSTLMYFTFTINHYLSIALATDIQCNESISSKLSANFAVDAYSFLLPSNSSYKSIIFSLCNDYTDFNTKMNLYDDNGVHIGDGDTYPGPFPPDPSCLTFDIYQNKDLWFSKLYFTEQSDHWFPGHIYNVSISGYGIGSNMFASGRYQLDINCTPNLSTNDDTYVFTTTTLPPVPDDPSALSIECGQFHIGDLSESNPTQRYRFVLPYNSTIRSVIITTCNNYTLFNGTNTTLALSGAHDGELHKYSDDGICGCYKYSTTSTIAIFDIADYWRDGYTYDIDVAGSIGPYRLNINCTQRSWIYWSLSGRWEDDEDVPFCDIHQDESSSDGTDPRVLVAFIVPPAIYLIAILLTAYCIFKPRPNVKQPQEIAMSEQNGVNAQSTGGTATTGGKIPKTKIIMEVGLFSLATLDMVTDILVSAQLFSGFDCDNVCGIIPANGGLIFLGALLLLVSIVGYVAFLVAKYYTWKELKKHGKTLDNDCTCSLSMCKCRCCNCHSVFLKPNSDMEIVKIIVEDLTSYVLTFYMSASGYLEWNGTVSLSLIVSLLSMMIGIQRIFKQSIVSALRGYCIKEYDASQTEPTKAHKWCTFWRCCCIGPLLGIFVYITIVLALSMTPGSRLFRVDHTWFAVSITVNGECGFAGSNTLVGESWVPYFGSDTLLKTSDNYASIYCQENDERADCEAYCDDGSIVGMWDGYKNFNLSQQYAVGWCDYTYDVLLESCVNY
eukprot:411284_1